MIQKQQKKAGKERVQKKPAHRPADRLFYKERTYKGKALSATPHAADCTSARFTSAPMISTVAVAYSHSSSTTIPPSAPYSTE